MPMTKTFGVVGCYKQLSTQIVDELNLKIQFLEYYIHFSSHLLTIILNEGIICFR
ncbi:hypothetical protein Hanom_Chr05g00404571 [Helianthus anomalus]